MADKENTKLITQALKGVAEELGFEYNEELRIAPSNAANSYRVDIYFIIPGKHKCPVLWFELDNRPDRVEHNQVKVFHKPICLHSLPAMSIELLHGKASMESHALIHRFLDDALVLPRRFLDALVVPTYSVKDTCEVLLQWLHKLFDELARSPVWGSVYSVASYYQPLIANGSLSFAVAHLEAHSELAWFLVERREMEVERAACLSVTMVRILQRAGFHSECESHIFKLRQRLKSYGPISDDTLDNLEAIEILLSISNFVSNSANHRLTQAFEKSRNAYHRTQFLWRQAIHHIARDNYHQFYRIISDYQQMTGGGLIPKSNIELLRAIDAVMHGRGDAREHAHNYSRLQHIALNKQGRPDGTVHGVITSLYLQLAAEIKYDNPDAREMIQKVNGFCSEFGVPFNADGLRELGIILPRVSTSTVNSKHNLPMVVRIGTELSRKRKDSLEELCSNVDSICLL